MKKKFEEAIVDTLQHEKGFVNHPKDPGGATNWGMSLRYLIKRGDLDRDGLPDGDMDGDGDVDIDDIRRMTKKDAVKLYYSGFWKPNRLSKIKSSLLPRKIFDMSVNMGSRQAWKLTQRAIIEVGGDLVVDGIVGRKTIWATNELFTMDYEVLRRLRDRQLNFYRDLVIKKPSLSVFSLGWYRRAMY